MRVGMGAECVRAYSLKEYVMSTVCRTIFCKQWYSASTFEDALYVAQKTCALEFDFAGGCCSAVGS
jgi:hypothetical protein